MLVQECDLVYQWTSCGNFIAILGNDRQIIVCRIWLLLLMNELMISCAYICTVGEACAIHDVVGRAKNHPTLSEVDILAQLAKCLLENNHISTNLDINMVRTRHIYMNVVRSGLTSGNIHAMFLPDSITDCSYILSIK